MQLTALFLAVFLLVTQALGNPVVSRDDEVTVANGPGITLNKLSKRWLAFGGTYTPIAKVRLYASYLA